ncbi:putative aminotransferase [Gordonia araii NBRC 100433]|uniref:Putative aminotransferase n=1 Tax=Gordonia araii NBRC 100433 TaxID=1073574 RepID=G7H370_9ACTN|nr:aminodeoxychorismate lyase [Gordonia araii]NNG96413.1 aminodeoxychorismate lyase [Gordonia araii NBRC 100433]GAB10295.1 putative aminotransferase [Gordonia araii NBRC 100433]
MATPVLFDVHGGRRDPQQPLLHFDDLAVVRGDGIFETLLVRDGQVCNLARHLARFRDGAARMDLPKPAMAAWDSTINAAAVAWSLANGDVEGQMRLVYTRGRESAPADHDAPERTTALVMISEVRSSVAQSRADGVAVCLLDRGYTVDFGARAPWQLIGAKTLSYAANMAALRHAVAAGFDDVIYTSSDGQVLEGPRSSVVAVTGRTLRTPPVESGILPGTTVAALFAAAREEGWDAEYARLPPADLLAADSVWMCSSVTIAARVTRIDDDELLLDEQTGAAAAEFAELASRAIAVA